MSDLIRFSVNVGAGRMLDADGGVLTAAALMEIEAGEYRWESDPGIVTMNTLISASTGKVVFESGGFGHHPLPLPLMAQLRTAGGHDDADSVGRIEELYVDGMVVRAAGWITVQDGDDDPGRRYAVAVAAGNLRGVSVDAEAVEQYVEYLDDENGVPVDAIMYARQWKIAGLTGVNWPADSTARIRMVDDPAEEMPEEMDDLEDDEMEDEPMAAAIVSGPIGDFDSSMVHAAIKQGMALQSSASAAPPAEWFQNPNLDRATPLVVEASGRVYGHLAPWQWGNETACHVGFGDRCVCAPPSPDGQYPYMLSGGGVLCADGSTQPASPIAYLGGHVADDGKVAWTSIKAAYDDPGNVGLIVNMGEDAHGIWLAGYVSPTRTEAERAVIRACGVSGHWRTRLQGDPHPGARLIGACCVLSEGFPKQYLTASVGPDAELPAPAQAPRATYDEDGLVVLVAANGTAGLAHGHDPVDRAAYDALSARVVAAEATIERLSAQVGLLDGPARQVVRERLSAG